MNIYNRIEKLESKVMPGSGFCTCPRAFEIVVIEPDFDRTEEEHKELIARAQKPENCDHCGRRIDKHLIVVE